MSLERLPSSTQERLRSAQLLTSVPQAVSELLQNALDANASHVEIGIDLVNWECWVRDDGEGISRAGLVAISSGRYNTSKTYDSASPKDLSTFGFRGEALASAADVSCIEIASRTTNKSNGSWSVIMKNGKCLYSGPSSRWHREKSGTVVCLRDIFYNMPVRRTSHPSPAKTLELIRKEIELYALMFPAVSLSLEDVSRAREGAKDTRYLTVSKTPSTLAAFRAIHGRALTERVQEIAEHFGDVTISGFISLSGALSKAYQHMYINRHPITPSNLHASINKEFSKSTFGKHGLLEDSSTSSPQAALRRSSRKTEYKPIYVLNISLPPRDVDNFVEPSKTSVNLVNDGEITAFLVSTIRAFLLRHGFTAEQSESPPSVPARKRRRLGQDPSPLKESIYSSNDPDALPEPPMTLYAYPGHANGDSEQEMVEWREPVTGVQYFVDPRTGNSYSEHDARRRNDNDEESMTRKPRRTLDPTSSQETIQDDMTPAWITEALRANTAYKLPERQIAAVLPASQSQTTTIKPTFHSCSAEHIHALDTQSTTFHNADLSHARVLAQVDRKFILLALGGEPGLTLALLDQHAASERIRVERLFNDLCEGKSTKLSAPAPVLLSLNEVRAIRDACELLAQWGLKFEPHSGTVPGVTKGETAYEQLFVCTVPEVVRQKLLAPGELGYLLKSIVAELESGELAPPSASQAQVRDDDFPWRRVLRNCPKGLIELVNSRACRGAIMFNDPLTPTQCQRLVAQLSQTAFPFQCAHGRPSLVPLARLGSISSRRKSRGRDVDWAAFK